MTNGILSLLVNMLMAGLLLATIFYCLKLNRRIRLLQDSRSELAQIIREFDESTKRATQNINEIHAATMRISENIQHKIDKANYLADDLDYMIEKGNKLAGKADPAPGRMPPRPEPMPSPAPAPVAAAPARNNVADIFPARASETPKLVESAEPSAEGIARRPLRARSRAEQELMTMLGRKPREGG